MWHEKKHLVQRQEATRLQWNACKISLRTPVLDVGDMQRLSKQCRVPISPEQIVIQGKAWKIYLFVCLPLFIIYVADFISEGNLDFLIVEFLGLKM